MAIVSALAVASARVWWLAAYWTPRARVFRRRARALELGDEWQRAREYPADDAWRQQVEHEIGTSAVTVPMTPDLLAAAVERGVPVSRRWLRRHRRAIARARSGPAGSAVQPVSRSVARRGRRALVRVVPIAAAMALGVVLGPALQHSVTHHPAGGQIGVFRYECSQCKPGTAHHADSALPYAPRIRVFADPTPPSWLLTDAQLRAAQRRSSQTSGSR